MSGKHTFTYTPNPDNPHDQTSVEVESTAESLHKVIEAMQAYLLAAGFVFPRDTHLDLVEDEDLSMIAPLNGGEV